MVEDVNEVGKVKIKEVVEAREMVMRVREHYKQSNRIHSKITWINLWI